MNDHEFTCSSKESCVSPNSCHHVLVWTAIRCWSKQLSRVRQNSCYVSPNEWRHVLKTDQRHVPSVNTPPITSRVIFSQAWVGGRPRIKQRRARLGGKGQQLEQRYRPRLGPGLVRLKRNRSGIIFWHYVLAPSDLYAQITLSVFCLGRKVITVASSSLICHYLLKE